MAEFTLKTGGLEVNINPFADGKMMEIEIGGKKAKIFSGDMAAVVRACMGSQADEYFAEVEEKNINKGNMRVAVVANGDIKKGEQVVFTVNVPSYIERANEQRKIQRLSPLIGVRTNNSGFIY